MVLNFIKNLFKKRNFAYAITARGRNPQGEIEYVDFTILCFNKANKDNYTDFHKFISQKLTLKNVTVISVFYLGKAYE